ncbi:MAG: clostripain-related cysteine peptidase [Planctomycetota bacterium]
MSYDNDLEPAGPVILDAIEKGVKGTKIAVAVLADDQKPTGLKRIVLDASGRRTETLDTDDSASEAVLADFLAWVAREYPSRHFALVFLNHGGRLDEMCRDNRTGTPKLSGWMSARKVGETLRAFKPRLAGSFDLLYLQQCGRSSVENLFSFRGTAKAVLASEMEVGSPNTYYEPLLQWLDKEKDATGAAAGKKILETDAHYVHLACMNGEMLSELPARLKPILEALQGTDASPPKPPAGLAPAFACGPESFYDLLRWMDAALRENRRPPDALAAFQKWMFERLVLVWTDRSAGGARPSGRYYSLSVCVPVDPSVRGLYADHPFNRESGLGALWEAMYPKGKTGP